MAVTVPGVFTELAPPLSDDEALVEADRCLECGGPYAPAPCVVACPAEVDVPGFVGAIARGEPELAAEIVWSENLLGGTCARVCPVETLCQGACVLLHEGRDAIEIGRLQRHATDRGYAAGVRLRRPTRPRAGRVAVVGAGPAGLACAGELAARGYTVTVYDERHEIGGLVRYAIAPYRQQRDPLPEEAAALLLLGVRFELDCPIDSPQALRELELNADAIFLGVGMGADADVSYPGDELEGVWESLPFIEAIKTDAAPELGGRVAVIGGGNTAIDVAIESIRLGADEVTMVYRRTRDEMPAYPHEVEQALAEGIHILFLANPVRFVGERRVAGVECLEMRLGEPDESGRRRPEPVPGSEFLLEADTVVKAIGQRPRAEFLSWVDGLELDRSGHVVVDDGGRTGNPRYYAAGDACNGGATVVEAVRGAKLAAASIAETLR